MQLGPDGFGGQRQFGHLRTDGEGDRLGEAAGHADDALLAQAAEPKGTIGLRRLHEIDEILRIIAIAQDLVVAQAGILHGFGDGADGLGDFTDDAFDALNLREGVFAVGLDGFEDGGDLLDGAAAAALLSDPRVGASQGWL